MHLFPMPIFGFCLSYLDFATFGNCPYQPFEIRLIIWLPNGLRYSGCLCAIGLHIGLAAALLHRSFDCSLPDDWQQAVPHLTGLIHIANQLEWLSSVLLPAFVTDKQ